MKNPKSLTSLNAKRVQQKSMYHMLVYVGLAYVLGFVLTMVSSCSVFDVSYTMDKEKDFSKYKTFAWFDGGYSDSISGSFDIDAASMDSAIRNSVEQHLTGKGYVEEHHDHADLWINYQAIAKTTTSNEYKYELKDINQTYKTKLIRYSSSLDASRRFTTRYELGTLIVDIIDRATSEVIWRGSVEMPLGLYNKEEKKINRLNKAINKLLIPFPSRPKDSETTSNTLNNK